MSHKINAFPLHKFYANCLINAPFEKADDLSFIAKHVERITADDENSHSFIAQHSFFQCYKLIAGKKSLVRYIHDDQIHGIMSNCKYYFAFTRFIFISENL